jgi:hypothetical protein
MTYNKCLEVIQSALLCYVPKLSRKKYIVLPNLNFDDVVMSCGNRNFHLRLFVKGGALQSSKQTVPGCQPKWRLNLE